MGLEDMKVIGWNRCSIGSGHAVCLFWVRRSVTRLRTTTEAQA